MRKLMVALVCCVLFATLATTLHAAQPASAAPADLAAQIFAPVSSPAVAAPAAPTVAAPAAFLLPDPRLTTCSFTVCISECNDCPSGKHPFCMTTTCTCGCR